MTSPAKLVEFLLARKCIPPSAALELEERRFPLIGLLAVQRGFMPWSRVQEVLERQKLEGRAFGETAISLKLLDAAQLQTLLDDQRAQVDLIERVLVGGKHLTRKAFRELLAEFHAASSQEKARC
ncbi:MAG: hypothetical protein AB1486_04430 [Planctomycetota bacterium]